MNIPKFIHPVEAAAVMEKSGPVVIPLAVEMSRIVIKEGLRELGQVLPVKRIWDLPKEEQLRTHEVRLLRSAEEVGNSELWWININLAPTEEHEEAINSLYKRSGIQKLWVGAKIPKPHPHVHLIAAFPINFNSVKRLAEFGEHRNVRKRISAPRSVVSTLVYDVAGLHRYLQRSDNLGRAGSKVIASRQIKARPAIH